MCSAVGNLLLERTSCQIGMNMTIVANHCTALQDTGCKTEVGLVCAGFLVMLMWILSEAVFNEIVGHQSAAGLDFHASLALLILSGFHWAGVCW